ncbi:MFS general substrate transporter [Gymnopus androsaceus JB14]|uniref:MFS general substrate transporter n=1 Tax=Gymnopus androsaceus JB14 TaxID=1447944 RepID=A0A6A4HXD7_9AGAR|nr:MFS general substrate transporter [Gymnopus androsaceus JB14]
MDHTSKEDATSIYSVFSPKQRRIILIIVCFAGMIGPLSSLMYTPALPAIADALGVSISDINLTITTYLIFQGITPSIWGSIGDVYGRRIVYIITLLIAVGASIGLCFSTSFAEVLVLRALYATGSASSTALGAGIIRDIVPPNIRGGYMGIYSAGVAVGTAFGPFLGGLLAQYASWHGIFWFLAALASFSLACISLLLPETLPLIVGNGSIPPPKYLRPPIPWLSPSSSGASRPQHLPRRRIDILGSLRIIRYPDVLCALVVTAIFFTVWQDSMVATSTIYALDYGLDEADIGLTYLANGIGSLLGNTLTGRLLDRDYQKFLERENTTTGEPMPPGQNQSLMFIEKARLRSLMYNAPLFVSCIVVFGWIIQIRAHIAVSIVLSFFIGWFDSSILITYSTLIVDLFPQAASTSSASINLVRCLLGAVGTSTIQLMITAIGYGWSFTTLGGICILSFPLIWLQWSYGPKFRTRRNAQTKQINVSVKSVEGVKA